MEQTNNEITEVKFTQNEILNGLMAMDEKARQTMRNVTLDQLDLIANNAEYLQQVYTMCDENIAAYQRMKDAAKVFVEVINNQKEKGCETVIDDMVEKYKGFSREEKLEFSKRMMDVTQLENSLDLFNYNWNKLMNKIKGVNI